MLVRQHGHRKYLTSAARAAPGIALRWLADENFNKNPGQSNSIRLPGRESQLVFSPPARPFQLTAGQSSVQMKVSRFPGFGRIHASGKRELSISQGAGDGFLCFRKARLDLFGVLHEREGAAPFAAGRLPDEVPPAIEVGAEKSRSRNDNQQKLLHLEHLLTTCSNDRIGGGAQISRVRASRARQSPLGNCHDVHYREPPGRTQWAIGSLRVMRGRTGIISSSNSYTICARKSAASISKPFPQRTPRFSTRQISRPAATGRKPSPPLSA